MKNQDRFSKKVFSTIGLFLSLGVSASSHAREYKIQVSDEKASVSCPGMGDREGLIQQDRVPLSMAGSVPNVFFFDSQCSV